MGDAIVAAVIVLAIIVVGYMVVPRVVASVLESRRRDRP
jgi:hypothetical protein